MKKLNKEDFAKNGYLVIKDFFSSDEIDKILLDALTLFSIPFSDKKKKDFNLEHLEKAEHNLFDFFKNNPDQFINLGKQAQHLISLWRLASSKKIEILLAKLDLKLPNFSVRPSIFFNSKYLDKIGHYWKLGDHQDWRSSQGSLDSVTIWFPYVDCNIELGSLEVIPGSHLNGLYDCSEVNYYSKIKEGLINEADYTPVEMKKGDLLIFNSFLVHRSGTNSTHRIRWSSQLRYNNLLEPTFINRRLPNPYIYKPFDKLLEPGPPSAQDLVNYFKNFTNK